MKKIMFFGLGLAVLNLTSCKKGENDPGISLRGRKARLTGEWVMKSLENTEKGTELECGFSGCDRVPYTETISVTNGTLSSTKNNETSKATSSIEQKYTFEKDGTYKYYVKVTRLTDEDGNSVSEGYEETNSEGTWAFINKNKEGEYKNKERISLIETSSSTTENDGSVSTTTNGDTYEGDWGADEFIFLDKLSNKELIIKSESKRTYVDDGTTYTDEETSESTWEKQ